jgi:hypothetical protein
MEQEREKLAQAAQYDSVPEANISALIPFHDGNDRVGIL